MGRIPVGCGTAQRPANNFYGIAIAAGPGEWTAWHYEVLLWQNGGFVFDTELRPIVDSPESIEALNFLKQLHQYSPPESATWEVWDSIDAFTSELVAISMYGGRLLVHTARDNPRSPSTRGFCTSRRGRCAPDR